MESTEIKYELPRSREDKLKDRNTPYVFKRNAQKSPVYNTPLLVIGLGGSGFDVLRRAKQKLINCFRTDSTGKLKGVEFLEIDTDDRDMKRSLSMSQISNLKKDEFKIFQNADIGAILRNRNTNSDVLPEEIDQWLDPDIPVAQIVHGAAGIRQAGRLLLHLNILEIVDIIKKKLDKIREGVSLSKNPVNVVIFTGLGGGTGSGIFIDVAYIVRQCIKEFSGQAFINGVLLMPDILAGGPNIDTITKENIKRNGFAALKELDHLMNLSETSDTFSQKFPGGFEIKETDEAIFERCVLVSSMAEGRTLLPDAKAHAYEIAAEMLVDMLSNSSIVSNGSNNVSRRDTALANTKRQPCNYLYTAVGGQAVYLDFDLIFNLFVKQVLDCDINRGVEPQRVEMEVNRIWRDKGVENDIKNLEHTREHFLVDDRKLYNLNYEEMDSTGKFVKKQVDEEYIRQNPGKKYIPILNIEAKEAYERDLEVLDRRGKELLIKFQDIYSTIESIGYSSYIDTMKTKIQTALKDTTHDLPESKKIKWNQNTKKIEKYRKYYDKDRVLPFNIPWGGPKLPSVPGMLTEISKEEAENMRDEKYREIIEDLIKEVSKIFIVEDNSKSNKTIIQELSSFHAEALGVWRRIFNAKYDPGYSVLGLNAGSGFAGEILEEVWKREGSLIGESSVVSESELKKVSVIKYIRAVEKIIEYDYKGNIHKAAEKFRNDLMDKTKTDFYLGKNGDFPDDSIAPIFNDFFKEIKLNLDGIMTILLENTQPELKDVWEEVVTTIIDHSGVLYSKKAMRDGEVFVRPVYNEFMIPVGTSLLSEVCKEITGRDAEESEICNRISCMKYALCHKIDDYIYIDELERVYNQTNSKSGLHLYENGQIRWCNLPSPVYRNKISDSRVRDIYEDAKNAVKYRYVFNKALEKGVIAEDIVAKKYYIDGDKLEGNLTGKKIYICTLEYTKLGEQEYREYCADWFVKMFRYRDLVADALGIKVDELSGDEFEEWVKNGMEFCD